MRRLGLRSVSMAYGGLGLAVLGQAEVMSHIVQIFAERPDSGLEGCSRLQSRQFLKLHNELRYQLGVWRLRQGRGLQWVFLEEVAIRGWLL